MGGYIRMDKDLEDDPRVTELGELLAKQLMALPREQLAEIIEQIGCDAVLGGLFKLWRHGDTHLRRHDRLGIASHRLAHVTGLPASLIAKFPLDWLRIHPDGAVELPGYSAKNALIDKDERRAKGRERTRRYREKKRLESKSGDAENGVTPPASHRHNGVTTGTGPGTGPGTVPTVPGTGTGPGAKTRENPAPARGELASAPVRLARRETPVEEIERRRREATDIAAREAAKA